MMKKAYLLLFISFFAAKLSVQATHTGSYINFPDRNFLNTLLPYGIEKYYDGKIDTIEA